MIHIKYCRKGKQPFDIATDKELCPNCRNNKEVFYGINKKRWRDVGGRNNKVF